MNLLKQVVKIIMFLGSNYTSKKSLNPQKKGMPHETFEQKRTHQRLPKACYYWLEVC
jgi:hypothetical protein